MTPTCTDALSRSATACWSSGGTVTSTFGGPPVCASWSSPPWTAVLTDDHLGRELLAVRADDRDRACPWLTRLTSPASNGTVTTLVVAVTVSSSSATGSPSCAVTELTRTGPASTTTRPGASAPVGSRPAASCHFFSESSRVWPTGAFVGSVARLPTG